MGWKIYDETVEMIERRYQYLPETFRWRGLRYDIDEVQRSWTTLGRILRPAVQRRFYLVRCGEGRFEIFQDLKTGVWWLRRAKLTSGRALPFRRMAPVWR